MRMLQWLSGHIIQVDKIHLGAKAWEKVRAPFVERIVESRLS